MYLSSSVQISVIALSLLCTLSILAATAQSTKPALAEITFPSDKEVGGLYTLPPDQSLTDGNDDRVWHAPAKATVRIPKDRIWALAFAENYKVVRDTLNIKGAEIIQALDLRDADVQADGLDNIGKFSSLRLLDLTSTSCPKRAFSMIAKLPNLECLSVRQTKFSDDDLAAISNMPKLRYLELQETPVTDGCSTSIKRMKQLDHLLLGVTAIGDKSAQEALVLPRLQTLKLDATRITSEFTPSGTSNVKKLTLNQTNLSNKFLSCGSHFPKLQILELRNTKIDNDGIVHLSEFPLLTELSIDGTKVHGPKAIEAFAKCKHLQELNLSRTGYTHQDLAGLVRVKRLSKLIFDRTPLDDKCLAAIKKLTGLTSMTLRNIDLSDEQIADLRKALPKCAIKTP